MIQLVIDAHGDNLALHEKALAAAVAAVEEVNKAPVYRAYLQAPEYTPGEGGRMVGVPNGG